MYDLTTQSWGFIRSEDKAVQDVFLNYDVVELARSDLWRVEERYILERSGKAWDGVLRVEKEMSENCWQVQLTAIGEGGIMLNEQGAFHCEKTFTVVKSVTRFTLYGHHCRLYLVLFEPEHARNLLGSSKHKIINKMHSCSLYDIFYCFSTETLQFNYLKISSDKDTTSACDLNSPKSMMRNEVDKLKLLNHDNVIIMKDHVSTPEVCYAVIEQAKGRSLWKIVMRTPGGLSEKESKHMVKQVLSGLAYIHLNGIVHHNIALDNIVAMTTDHYPRVKITSFGRSRFSYAESSDPCRRSQQSLRFQAPEVLTTAITRSGCKCGKKIDVWSLGVCFYMLLVGDCPFGIDESSDDEEKVLTKIRNKRSMFCPLFDDEKISAEAKMFVRDCLSEEEGRRPTSGELATCRYLTTYDVVLI